jgi:enoyl-CoA hydratase
MSSVRTEVHDGLCVIHMNDQKANAINGPLLDGLTQALDQAQNADQAIVLCGRPGFFSGGLDLKTLPTLGQEELLKVLKQFGEVMIRMFTFRRPLVAACTGHAIAGGMVTLLACDERVGTDGAFKLGLNETAIGLSLPAFVTEFARCQLGPQHLQSVIANGDLFPPQAALAMGMVNELVPVDEVIPQAMRRAKKLSALPAQAYADNKMSVRGPYAQKGQDAYASELKRFQGYFGEPR